MSRERNELRVMSEKKEGKREKSKSECQKSMVKVK